MSTHVRSSILIIYACTKYNSEIEKQKQKNNGTAVFDKDFQKLLLEMFKETQFHQ